MSENVDFLVRTFCATYNQESYIAEALWGFIIQKTTFPVVYMIVDDASTDSTAVVIQRFVRECFDLNNKSVAYEKDTDYGHVTFAQHKTNLNCYFAVVYLKENHYSKKKSKSPYLTEWKNTKYIAQCEGDDYWTDPLKLQKQVDFMETNQEYALCFHKVQILSSIEKDKYLFSYLKEGDYSAREIYKQWIIPTCSVLYRNYPERPFEHHPSVVFGDIYIWLQLAERGKLYCMGFNGATYRRHKGSASCSYPVETSIKLYGQYLYFEKRFPELRDISRHKQDEEGLADIIKAPYFPGIWKYRFLYMRRHRRLFLSPFLVETVFLYTPIRRVLFWKKK